MSALRYERECCSHPPHRQHSHSNIYAKPVIDLLVEVRDINELDGQSSEMESLGYCVTSRTFARLESH
jgi:GrpB protein